VLGARRKVLRVGHDGASIRENLWAFKYRFCNRFMSSTAADTWPNPPWRFELVASASLAHQVSGHSVDVSAESVYEAAALGLARLRRANDVLKSA
jgi:hypothetical protein